MGSEILGQHKLQAHSKYTPLMH